MVRKGFLTPWPPHFMETIKFHLSSGKEHPLPDCQKKEDSGLAQMTEPHNGKDG